MPEDILFSDLAPRTFPKPWRDGLDHLALPETDTPHQCRRSSASRDPLLRKRIPAEVTLRGLRAFVLSMRTYHKPGRIQKRVSEDDPRVAACGLDIMESFESYVQNGRFPDLQREKIGKKSSSF